MFSPRSCPHPDVRRPYPMSSPGEETREPVTTAPARSRRADHEHSLHQHRDVSGGWLRPAVFGAMDGLVTNVSLISGVGGGGVDRHTIVLTGLAASRPVPSLWRRASTSPCPRRTSWSKPRWRRSAPSWSATPKTSKQS